jgi:sugar O-acyltransferase (sialic acid O-acetyltransferase NeuD family)
LSEPRSLPSGQIANSDRPLLVYGAGGHGLVVAEAAAAAGWEVRGFIDDGAEDGQTLGGWSVLRPGEEPDADAAVIVAIGDNGARRRVAERLVQAGARLVNVVHPTAWVSASARLSSSVYVGPHAAVNGEAEVGDGVIINTGAIVEHHCRIGGFAHVGPGAAMAGRVRLGALSLLGVNAAVRPDAWIGEGCTVGAGAVVVGDVPDGLTVAGVPAKPIAPG